MLRYIVRNEILVREFCLDIRIDFECVMTKIDTNIIINIHALEKLFLMRNKQII